MRPINKGSSPIRGDFASYHDALPYLIERLGNYCSYCEREYDSALTVEHIFPKIKQKHLEKRWSNLLLACNQCNPTKGDTDIAKIGKKNFIWPDEDDTYHMMEYPAINAYRAAPAKGLSKKDALKVNNTINLTGINKSTDKYKKTAYQDRLAKRQEVAKICLRQKKSFLIAKKLLREIHDPLSITNYQSIKQGVFDMIQQSGCWSIWMHTFEGIPEIKEELLNQTGTNRTFF